MEEIIKKESFIKDSKIKTQIIFLNQKIDLYLNGIQQKILLLIQQKIK